MQPKIRLLLMTVSVILFSFVSTSVFGQATVHTDQDDYPPGAVVQISGSGFQPGETVTLQVTHVGDGDNSTSGAHAPWDVVADTDGNISSTWTVPADEDELGATLKLTTDGKASGLHAETFFTDALRTDTYPSVFSTFTGGASYCLNAATSNLSVTWSNTTCDGTQNGNNTNIPITITWYKNTTNTTIGGTSVQVTNTNASTTSSTFTPPSNAAGTLYYYVTISWSGGANCAVAGSITTNGTQQIKINPFPALFNVTGGGAFCSGATGAAIGLDGSETGVNYQLKNGALNIGSPVAGTGSAISFGNQTTAGTYTVVATNATTTCARTMTGNAAVTINSLPNDASGSFTGNTICNGDAGTLSFDAIDASFVTPYTIQYTDGTTSWSQTISTASSTTFSVAVNPTVTTNYALVSITNGNGCTITSGFTDATAQITVRPTPTASISGTATVCRNGSSPNITFTNPQSSPVTVTYNINGASNLTVNVPANSSANVAVPTATAGVFNYNLVSVNYQTAPNCANNISGTATITVRPTPTATISGTTTVCQNASSPNIIFTNPQALAESITYNINGGAATTIDVAANSSSTVAVPTGTAGIFNYNLVSVVYLDGSPGCSNNISGTATVTVRQPATATIDINGSNPICSGSTTSIKFTGPSNGIVTYNINGGPGISASLNNGGNFVLTTATLTSNTTYNLVSIAYGDNPDCSTSASGSVTVTVNQPPSITASNLGPFNNDNDACGASITLGSNVTINAGTPSPTLTYSLTNFGSTISNPYTFPVGTTTVYVKASNSCGDDIKSFTVTVDDVTPPALTGSWPSDQSNINACSAPAGATESEIAALYTDACDGVITVVKSIASQTTAACGWSVTYSYHITDQYGNAIVTDPTITYSGGDKTAPSLTGTIPGGGSNLNLCYSAIPAGPTESEIAAQYTDNCGGAITVVKSGTPTGDNCSWSVTYHYTIRDACNNYATAVDITYSGGDTGDPVITNCKTSTTRIFDFNETNYTVQGSEFDVSASDNCSLSSLTYSLSGVTSGTGTTLAGVDLNEGKTTITWTATDGCGHTKQCTFDVTVNKRPTTLTYTGDFTEQYSDVQLLTATLVDLISGTPLVGKTISFTLGSQSISDGPGAPGNGTNSSGIAEANLQITQNVGKYNLGGSFAGDGTYLSSSFAYNSTSPDDRFSVIKEDAVVNYTGQQLISTAYTSVDVLLTASINDINDASRGNISTAKVKFVVETAVGSIPVTQSPWQNVNLVDGTVNSTDGYAAWTWEDAPVPSNAGDQDQYNVRVIVNSDGNYIGDDISTLDIMKTTTIDFITGGGHVIPTSSLGTYKADNGRKMNFGFNIKWNKSFKNLQGKLNVIYRVGSSIYQVKTNATSSLTINSSNPCSKTAVFSAKANLTDITNPLAPVTILSGLNLTLKITDNGEPGNNDKWGLSLYNGSTLIMASQWGTGQLQELTLGGGNIVIHSGTECPNQNNSVNPRIVQNEPAMEKKAFEIKAYPNPTTSQFIVKLESSNTIDPISLIVYSVNGKIVEQKQKLTAGQTIQLGALYRPGVYIVEMIQGKEHRQLKLVKIPD